MLKWPKGNIVSEIKDRKQRLESFSKDSSMVLEGGGL